MTKQNKSRGNVTYDSSADKNIKQPKKDWRKRTTHQKNGLPKNLRVEIPVSIYGMTLDGKDYDGSTFIEIMENLQANDVFNKISIPVYAQITVREGKTLWHKVIGYIKEFNEMGSAVCVIYAKDIKAFNEIESPVIVPRVAIKDNKCSCVIGLDIVPENLMQEKMKK